VYRTRFEVEVDEQDKPIARKLVQLFFAHRQQLEAAQRFVADWLIVIDGTFNINELRLPLFVLSFGICRVDWVCLGVLKSRMLYC
jgi:hypothetical protein